MLKSILNNILKVMLYCATIAYHVGLNANSGGCRTPANDQGKWTFGFDRVRVLECTIAVSFGNSSFSHWPPYWKAFEIPLKIFYYFLRIYVLLDVNFQLFASFYYIDFSDIFFEFHRISICFNICVL